MLFMSHAADILVNKSGEANEEERHSFGKHLSESEIDREEAGRSSHKEGALQQ